MSKEAAAKAAREKAEREKREASEATKASHREHAEAAAAREKAEKETLEAAQAEREAKRAEREAADAGSNTNPEEKTMGKNKNKGGGKDASDKDHANAAKEQSKDARNEAVTASVYYRIGFRKDILWKGIHTPAGTVINTTDKTDVNNATNLSACLYVQKVETKGGKKVRTVLWQASEDVRVPPEAKKGKGSRSKDADDGNEDGDGGEEGDGDGSDDGAGDE